jgi:hypothetical protein
MRDLEKERELLAKAGLADDCETSGEAPAASCGGRCGRPEATTMQAKGGKSRCSAHPDSNGQKAGLAVSPASGEAWAANRC